MNHYYNKYKKAKRTLDISKEQIEKTKNEIDYYKCLLEQLSVAKSPELIEISEELNLRNTKNTCQEKIIP